MIWYAYMYWKGFPCGANGKEPTCQCRRLKRPGWILVSGRSLEEEMAAHSRILAWRISWTEEPGGPQTTGSQRVGYDWSDLACTCMCIEMITTVKLINILSLVCLPFVIICFDVYIFPLSCKHIESKTINICSSLFPQPLVPFLICLQSKWDLIEIISSSESVYIL